MPLSKELCNAYTSILKEELVSAMGCTEPIAIAYAASILSDVLGQYPERIEAHLSGNIIKNVKSVIVPATGGLSGIEAAIAAGVISARPEKKLEVLACLDSSKQPLVAEYREKCPITVSELESVYPFALEMVGTVGSHTAEVHIMGNHTNVTLVKKDGEAFTKKYLEERVNFDPTRTDRGLLTVKDIVAFAEEVDLEQLRPILGTQIAQNMAIAEEGLRGEYGACIGKTIYGDGNVSVRDKARAYAAAGSDARMSGCELPVCIISGSGNQGITACVPVMVYARDMGVDEDTALRALIVSDLITIHQKTGIGCLSAYCGAISAGCGCATGICYLMGGRYYEIAHTLVNSVAILSGTICDGAKASCAAKIAMAVEAGIMGYDMMKSGHQFYGGDGIITKGVENTLRNIGKLAREGMSETDKEIIRIMLGEN